MIAYLFSIKRVIVNSFWIKMHILLGVFFTGWGILEWHFEDFCFSNCNFFAVEVLKSFKSGVFDIEIISIPKEVSTFFAQPFWLIESFLTSLGICDGLEICFEKLCCLCNGTLKEMFSSTELMGAANESVSVTLSFKSVCFSWRIPLSGNKVITQLNRSLLALQFFFFFYLQKKKLDNWLIDASLFFCLEKATVTLSFGGTSTPLKVDRFFMFSG